MQTITTRSNERICQNALNQAVQAFRSDGDRLRLLKVLNGLQYSFEDAQQYIRSVQTAH